MTGIESIQNINRKMLTCSDPCGNMSLALLCHCFVMYVLFGDCYHLAVCMKTYAAIVLKAVIVVIMPKKLLN